MSPVLLLFAEAAIGERKPDERLLSSPGEPEKGVSECCSR